MTLPEHLRRMARNNLWSNDRVYRAVLTLRSGEFEAERISFFPSIRATLIHILAVDYFYLDCLTGGGKRAASCPQFSPCLDAVGLSEAQLNFDRKLIAFFDSLVEADLERRVIVDLREDETRLESIDNMLAHLFLHDIHHRGQVHAMLCSTSVAPPQLDEFLLDCDLGLRRDPGSPAGG